MVPRVTVNIGNLTEAVGGVVIGGDWRLANVYKMRTSRNSQENTEYLADERLRNPTFISHLYWVLRETCRGLLTAAWLCKSSSFPHTPASPWYFPRNVFCCNHCSRHTNFRWPSFWTCSNDDTRRCACSRLWSCRIREPGSQQYMELCSATYRPVVITYEDYPSDLRRASEFLESLLTSVGGSHLSFWRTNES